MKNARVLVLASSLVLSCTPALAQVAIGAPPFGSFGGGPDVINLGNLNANWTIPIRNKPGRGTNFVYNLTYDSSVWYPVGSTGAQSWQPAATWGWQHLAGGISYASYPETTTSGICDRYGDQYTQYSFGQVVYVDQFGTSHSFPSSGGVYIISNGIPPCPANGAQPSGLEKIAAGDGSGYVANVQVTSSGLTIFITKSGTTIYPPVIQNAAPPVGSYYSFDANGNEVTSANGVYTDTLGTQALSVIGGAPSNTVLSYANAGGTSTYTVAYTSYNIKTNFGCTGITEYTASGVYLPSTITLPDGTSYQFEYEATPGYSGYVTGRPLSVRLPTGGTITYAYQGSNNGIVCADGSAAGLTRTTPDGTWTYARSGSVTQWQTTVTAPAYNSVSDQTVSTFLTNGLTSPVLFYEIERQLYAGSSSSGTLLETINTCYSSNCSSTYEDNQAQVTSPISTVRGMTLWPSSSGVASAYIDSYDTYGNVASHAVYDYGAPGSGTHGSLLQTTANTYSPDAQYTPVLMETTVTDGQAPPNTVTLSDTQYVYDGATIVPTSGTPSHLNGATNSGNLTSVKKLVSGSTWQTSTYTYFDTGNVATSTDFNGTNVTTYTYNSTGCANSLLTGTSTPVKNPAGTVTATLTTGAAPNCSGGVPATTTDANGNITTYNYGSDPFWRPVSVTDAAQNVTNFAYPTGSSPNTSSTAMSFNTGNASVNNTWTTTDGMGRTILQQKAQNPSASGYDTTAASYDSRGRAACQSSVPYLTTTEGSYTAPNSSNGNCTTYDALGRPSSVTDAGGGNVAYTYNRNDVLVSKAPPPLPSTENPKQRSLEYNGAGQLASVCEIVTSTLPAGGSCGQNTTHIGYLTQYTYDGGNLTQTQQNVQAGSGNIQTRTVSYDAMGRKLSETIPEWSPGNSTPGTTSYVYDSITSGNCTSSSTGDLVESTDNAGNVTCYAYDSMHRPLNATVVQLGNNQATTPVMNYVYDAATYGSTAMQNAKGNLAEAYTGTSSAKITDLYFSNSIQGSGATKGGIVSQVWESTLNSHGYFLTTATSYPNGALGVLSSSITGVPTMNYGVDGEGRPYSASDGTSRVATTSYNTASSATGVNYGNGDSDTFGYDVMNRPNSILYTVTGSSAFTMTSALTWNANSSLGTMAVTDTNDSTKNQSCTYSADDLSRLANSTCKNNGVTQWGQNFTYDAFGNINKSGSANYAAAYNKLTNQVSTGAPAGYDANGNQLSNTALTSLTWNAAGQPATVTPVSTGSAIAGTYDALGRLVETVSGSTYTQFVFSPAGGKLAVVQGGSLIKATIPLPGGETAEYNNSGLNFIRHTDWLGSSRLATTWAHAVYSKEAYAPFGETYNEAGTADRSFTGQDQDTVTGSGATGIYDFLFRKYDPAAGRWLSPDPAGWSVVDQTDPQSLDRYAYVENQPLNAIDPEGLDICVSPTGVSMDTGSNARCPAGWSTVIEQNSVKVTAVPGFCYDPSCASPTQSSGDPIDSAYQQNQLTTGNAQTHQAPNNAVVSFAKQWWKDVKSCVGGVGIPAIEKALNPFSLGVGTAADVTSQMSQSSLAAAASYSVSKGLTVPLRSSIVRAGVGGAETLGKASGVLTVVSIDYALLQGVIAEWNGCQ